MWCLFVSKQSVLGISCQPFCYLATGFSSAGSGREHRCRGTADGSETETQTSGMLRLVCPLGQDSKEPSGLYMTSINVRSVLSLPQNISVCSASVLHVSPPDAVKSTLHYSMQSLKAQLPLVIVKVCVCCVCACVCMCICVCMCGVCVFVNGYCL